MRPGTTRPTATRPRADSERGSATILGLGVIVLLFSLLLGFLLLGVAVRTSLLARAAADSAALAGSAELLKGADVSAACAAATDLASANGATLLECGAEGSGDAEVRARLRVEVAVPIPGLDGLGAHATARAGAVPQEP